MIVGPFRHAWETHDALKIHFAYPVRHASHHEFWEVDEWLRLQYGRDGILYDFVPTLHGSEILEVRFDNAANYVRYKSWAYFHNWTYAFEFTLAFT